VGSQGVNRTEETIGELDVPDALQLLRARVALIDEDAFCCLKVGLPFVILGMVGDFDAVSLRRI
jgi:hypothetical protein